MIKNFQEPSTIFCQPQKTDKPFQGILRQLYSLSFFLCVIYSYFLLYFPPRFFFFYFCRRLGFYSCVCIGMCMFLSATDFLSFSCFCRAGKYKKKERNKVVISNYLYKIMCCCVVIYLKSSRISSLSFSLSSSIPSTLSAAIFR